MLIIVGAILVTLCVFGGFMLAGGNIWTVAEAATIELFIIGGGAFGAFVVANSLKTLKASFSGFLALLKPAKFQRQDFIDVLKMLYEILQKIRKDGLMSIEDHVENPQNSAIFQKYPKVLEDHHLLDFTTDCLRLIVGGNLAPHELEGLLEVELETHHKEAHGPSHAIQNVADALPAFGIVAAVLGIVKVMSIVGDAPPAVIGQKVASALVGTFLGILLGYGYVGPVANALATRADEDSKPYELVKMALIAYLRGYPPQVAIEFARKLLFSEVRPSFQDLEAELKGAK